MTTNNSYKSKKDFYLELLEIAETAEQKEFINHELELLERKKISSANRKSANSEENEQMINAILAYYEENPDTVATCGQIMKVLQKKNIKTEKELSTSRVSALMSKICGSIEKPIPDAPIKRQKDGRIMHFVKA